VAKILVADDNSNIQKMVVLALKDQGIDVVAVGNGEAAVRKISDIRPDLVLADVFMPVRNGYEVCQYVKTDSSLAHIPVILLVGAFDPLDEQEAQRVGADGVLKKPFVPPDPLISMVKSALARAGVSLTGAPAAPEQARRPASDLLINPNAAPRPLGSVHPITSPPGSAHSSASPASITMPALDSEPLHEEAPMRHAQVKIDAGGSPLAFGNLLGSTATQEEEDLAFIPTVHPESATERDWRSAEEQETEEEVAEDPKASWRRDAAEVAFAAADKTPSAVRDWRETGIAEAPAARQRTEEWTPTKEKTEIVATEDVPETIPAAVVETVLSDARASAQTTPFAGDAWAAAIAAGSEEKTALAAQEKAPVCTAAEATPAAAALESPVKAPGSVPEAADSVETGATKSSSPNSWFQTSSSPWETEAQKASQLASTWDAPVTTAASAATEVAQAAAPQAFALQEEALIGSESAESGTQESPSAYAAEPLRTDVSHSNGEHSAFAQEPEALVAPVEEVATPAREIESAQEQVSLPSATVEAIREGAAQITEDAQHEAAAPAAQASMAAPSAVEPSMDDLVARVLAKVSPEVLQAVTRDILKSVVEGIVRDELNSKKP
jgi:CheY-like chemotaxis protein